MAIRTKRWTRLEYERLIDLGAFGPEDRLELLGGQLVVREPQRRPHSTGIRLVAQALRAAFGPRWSIEAQQPVSLDEESEPEPDVAVVAGGPRDYLASHPSRPALVVEIALTSLALDRGEKAGLYARAGIEDYWIVNLVDNTLEVYRDPQANPVSPYGWRYGSALTLSAGDRVRPLSVQHAEIRVADLLPYDQQSCADATVRRPC
jgi:Uma2 family endonuclease